MLKKKSRLKTSSSFRATYCQNRVVSDEFFLLFAGKTKHNPNDIARIGFVVSKKINKRAVVRNKIKRRLREACKIYLKENNPACISFIFKAKETSQQADFQAVLTSVYKLFGKIAKKIT